MYIYLEANEWWKNLASSFQYYHLRKNKIDEANPKSIIKMYKEFLRTKL